MTDTLEQVLHIRKNEYEAEKLESEKRRNFDAKQTADKIEFELEFFIPRVKAAIEKAIVSGKYRIDVPFRDVGFHRKSCLENTNFIDNVTIDHPLKEKTNEIAEAIKLLENSGYTIVECGAYDNKFSLEWKEKHVRGW